MLLYQLWRFALTSLIAITWFWHVLQLSEICWLVSVAEVVFPKSIWLSSTVETPSASASSTACVYRIMWYGDSDLAPLDLTS